ncbi:beta-mannosidase [Deinococcus sonorensis]|uniref:Beta-mannosidase B n=2 Tax=Deinococcus sonorensis TaxID=309891 RepID=A0AAU7U7N5_9DEIO
MIEHPLNSNWQFKPRDPSRPVRDDVAAQDGWTRASVPGSVHQDLLAQGRIPDPYHGQNETQVQWVGQQDWLYRLTFAADSALLKEPHLQLHFAGLDTLCTVWLNGEPLLTSNNMFVPQTVDVGGRLHAGDNTLVLLFENVLEAGHALEARYGVQPAWNGDRSRVYIRKAQYHYGWDWGPVLLTAGPWQPVTLRAFRQRIRDVHVPSEVTPDLTTAFVPVEVTLEGEAEGSELQIELRAPDGQLIEARQVPASEARTLFEVHRPQLWYPNGLGEQPLYTASVVLLNGETWLDHSARRIGLRRLRLVQDPVQGEPGRSFTFEVNNQPLFIGGANWIPDDLLLNRISPERYRTRLQQARDGNLTMIRVWGGGIYEQDVFYDLCDELGLLVWQDFMFACGLYPAHPEFLTSVRAEAVAAVTRLRHHPSLAIWAGNNEDYAIAESVGVAGPGIAPEAFPARAIYEGVLPEVCAQLDPQRLYWPGSPWGGVTSADPTIGDRHSWEVWHGPMAPYQDYLQYQGRFVSEFGLQSAPALSTLLSVLSEGERYPESRTVVHHNKATHGPTSAPDGHRRLAVYLADNLRATPDLAGYVYATQFVQAEAMRYAYRDFRSRFEQPGRYAVSGALVWQLNDCWPGTSWAIIDSAGIVKPAYHTIRRELAPLAVALRRQVDGVEVWVSNLLAQARTLSVQLYAYTLDGELMAQESRTVRALPGRRTDLPVWTAAGETLVYFAELSADGELLGRSSDFPEPYKYHDYGGADLRAERVEGGVRLSASRPTKGVWLDASEPLRWNDNFIDLRPGETRLLSAPDLRAETVEVRALGSGAQRLERAAVVPTS